MSGGKPHFHPFSCTGRKHPMEIRYSTILIWLIKGQRPSGHHSSFYCTPSLSKQCKKKVSCKEGGKNKKNKKLPQLGVNKSGTQNTTQSKQKKNILMLHFKVGFGAPPALSESLQIEAAWLCMNAGEELHRNHNKRWKDSSQKWIFFPCI